MAGMDAWFPAQVRENKFASAILIWFMGNAVASALRNTGAFEIYRGRTLVWSTLKEGHLPNYAELVEALKAAGLDL